MSTFSRPFSCPKPKTFNNIYSRNSFIVTALSQGLTFFFPHKDFSSYRQCRQMPFKEVSEAALDYINRRAPMPPACHFTFHPSREGRRWMAQRDGDGGSEPGTDCQPSPSLLWIKTRCQGCPRLGGDEERWQPHYGPESCSEPTFKSKGGEVHSGGWRECMKRVRWRESD